MFGSKGKCPKLMSMSMRSVRINRAGLTIRGAPYQLKAGALFSVRMGKRRTGTLFPNAEGVRRDRAPKTRGVSMQLGVWVSAVSSPQRAGPGGARPPNDTWCIFGLKMLDLARPSRAVVKCLQKIANRLWHCAKSFSCQTDSSAKNQSLTISIICNRKKEIFPITDMRQVIPFP